MLIIKPTFTIVAAVYMIFQTPPTSAQLIPGLVSILPIPDLPELPPPPTLLPIPELPRPPAFQLIEEGPCPNVTCMKIPDISSLSGSLLQVALASPYGDTYCEGYIGIMANFSGDYDVLVHFKIYESSQRGSWFMLEPATENDRTFNVRSGPYRDKFCVVHRDKSCLTSYHCVPINATHTLSAAVIRRYALYFISDQAISNLKQDFLNKGASPQIVEAIRKPIESDCYYYVPGARSEGKYVLV